MYQHVKVALGYKIGMPAWYVCTWIYDMYASMVNLTLDVQEVCPHGKFGLGYTIGTPAWNLMTSKMLMIHYRNHPGYV